MKTSHMMLAALLVFGSIDSDAQTRTDVFDPANYRYGEVILTALPDAGCSVRWCGSVTSNDGGTSAAACTQPLELTRAANRSQCNAMHDQGVGRVLRELRFNVADAGTP